MVISLARMLPHLRCPRTGSPLRQEGEKLIANGGYSYPIVNGKPILVRNIRPMHVTPPDGRVVSKNTDQFDPGDFSPDLNALFLHLGSGNVPSENPRVISMDVLPNENVDLVAEAEALPFATRSLDRVFSDAVFEHVYDPFKSAAEVRRVLKEDGTFFISTAFMQGYHGFPGHYFNMTPQAAETYLIDDFIVEETAPPHPGAALHHLLHGFNAILEKLPEVDRTAMRAKPLGEVLESFAGGNVPEIFQGRLHDFVARSLGATSAASGRKPRGYDEGAPRIAQVIGHQQWAALKREYYTARTALVREHEAAGYWRMRAVEDMGVSAEPVSAEIPDMNAILHKGIILDPMIVDAWRTATEYLESERTKIVEIRDGWITKYLQSVDHQQQEKEATPYR